MRLKKPKYASEDVSADKKESKAKTTKIRFKLVKNEKTIMAFSCIMSFKVKLFIKMALKGPESRQQK